MHSFICGSIVLHDSQRCRDPKKIPRDFIKSTVNFPIDWEHGLSKILRNVASCLLSDPKKSHGLNLFHGGLTLNMYSTWKQQKEKENPICIDLIEDLVTTIMSRFI